MFLGVFCPFGVFYFILFFIFIFIFFFPVAGNFSISLTCLAREQFLNPSLTLLGKKGIDVRLKNRHFIRSVVTCLVLNAVLEQGRQQLEQPWMKPVLRPRCFRPGKGQQTWPQGRAKVDQPSIFGCSHSPGRVKCLGRSTWLANQACRGNSFCVRDVYDFSAPLL